MADGVEIKVEGLDGILDNMAKLEAAVQRKVARAATRKGAEVIAAAARKHAFRVDNVETPNKIWKNVYVQYAPRTSRRVQGIAFRVGILGGAKAYKDNRENRSKRRVGKKYAVGGSSTNPGGDTFYWRFLEFGTSKMAAHEFMRPAMNESGETAFRVVGQAFTIEIDKAMAGMGGK